MKVVLVSQNERHAFLLAQLELEGHEVCLLCREDTGAWKGLVHRAADLGAVRAFLPDVVLIDSPGFGPVAKVLTGDGLKVFGGSKLQDRLADDYLHGMSLLDNAGVKTSEFTPFTDVSEASAYVQGKNHPWLLRLPDGRTYNAGSDIELQLYLEHLVTTSNVPPKFTIQRGFPAFVDHSLVIRPSFYLAGLFNSEGLMNPALKLDMSYNLLPDGQGVPTVEGVNMRSVSASDPLVMRTLKKLEDSLQGFNYTGFVFLGCMTTSQDEVVVVDFQCAPPDGFLAAFCRGLDMPLGKFLEHAVNPRRPAQGKRSLGTPYKFHSGWTCSRKLTLPPYPSTEASWLSPQERTLLSRQGIPQTVFSQSAATQGVLWNDVYRRSDGDLQACGPLIGYAVGRGATYPEAERSARYTALGLGIKFIQVKVDDSLAAYNLE